MRRESNSKTSRRRKARVFTPLVTPASLLRCPGCGAEYRTYEKMFECWQKHLMEAAKTQVTLDQTPIEYHTQPDKRKRATEHILDEPFADSQILDQSQRRGKDRQIIFKVSPFGFKVLEETAALWNMNPNRYVKTLVYEALGLYYEPMDQRRKKRK